MCAAIGVQCHKVIVFAGPGSIHHLWDVLLATAAGCQGQQSTYLHALPQQTQTV